MSIQKRLVLLFIVGLIFVLSACNEDDLDNVERYEYTVWDAPVSEVLGMSLPEYYITTGSMVSDHRIDIASRTSGYIRNILVREGEKVTIGETLVMLDESDVEGAIQQAQETVNKSLLALKDADIDLERYKTLFNSKTVSESTFRKIQLHRDLIADTVDTNMIALKMAKSQRQYIKIISPIEGSVVTRHKRTGDLTAPSMPILTIESSERLLFETYVAESHIRQLGEGDIVSVKIDVLDGSLNGSIARIVSSGDPVTRKYKVKILLPKQSSIYPGMFGRTYFKVGSNTAPVVQETSLTEVGGLRGVFVVNGDNEIHFRWLRLGKVFENKVEVLVGLEAGERIVSSPDRLMREGDLINVNGNRSE